MHYAFEEHDYALHIWGIRLWFTHFRNKTTVNAFEEHDYGLHIRGTRLWFTHLRNTTMVYVFAKNDYALRIWGIRQWFTHLRNKNMVYTLQEHDYGWHIKQLGSVVELVIKLIIWLTSSQVQQRTPDKTFVFKLHHKYAWNHFSADALLQSICRYW